MVIYIYIWIIVPFFNGADMPNRLEWLDKYKEDIINMHLNGTIMDDIAICFNVSRASISRRLLDWGYTNHWNIVDITEDKLYELYHNNNLSEQRIADIYNCSRAMIHRRMVRFNIERRSYSECKAGDLNPFYGKKHTYATKKSMSLSFSKGRRSIVGSNRYGKGAYYETPNQGKKWMRSGWEIKVADYLTSIGKIWYYENGWLEMDDVRYLPDFYLPVENKYIEVKGIKFKNTMYKLEKASTKYDIEIWDRKKLIILGLLKW